MNTDALKIDIAQQVLNLSDINLLEKINNLLNKEAIVGYSANGTPITKSDFIKDMQEVERKIEAGTLKTYTTQEVRAKILNHK
ncbi:MAG: hypothetical protein CSA38_03210 [Flavobacteriales bacterium]|nr:MAG: hypothetical protein CSA38_03210 [Flavobacteriales bacterium]